MRKTLLTHAVFLIKIINAEARRLQFLEDSDRLNKSDKQLFQKLLDSGMDQSTLIYSIRELSELLEKHYGEKVIILIDEYDVPLAKANERGYYQEMVGCFCDALLEGKPELVEQLFTAYMKKTISVRDTFVRRPTKENFYHGILLGILSFKAGRLVSTNREAGDGFSDIMISIYDSDVGIIIEVKYAEDGDLEAECKKAIDQIEIKSYEEAFLDTDVRKILKYGIACNRKQCRVILAEE